MKTMIKRIVKVGNAPSDPESESKNVAIQIQFLKSGTTTEALFITTREAAFLLSESTGVGIEAITT